MTLDTASTKTLARSVTNAGTVTWTGGTVQGNNNTTFNNLAGAVFDMQLNGHFFQTTDASVRTFNNAGTLRRTAGTGMSTWEGTLNNTGTLELRTGTFNLPSTYAPSAGSALTVYIGGVTAGAEFSRLVGSTMIFAGTLNVVLTNGFNRALSNSFTVVDSSSGGSGAFSATTGRSLRGGLILETNYSGGDLTLLPLALNSAPSLAFATNNVVVLEDAGAFLQVGFASATLGTTNEVSQSITNYGVSAADPALFSAQPALALNGTLTFAPAADANGATMITVIAQDNGGTANDAPSFALRAGGALKAWGYNSDGMLGDGTTVDRTSPVQIGTATNWQSVAASFAHTVAVKSDGTLWAWGANSDGRLGDGTTVQRITPMQIGTATDWQSVAAGDIHTVALKRGGSLSAWGKNENGQLGDGTTVDRPSPVQIGTATNWLSVAARGYHTVALAGSETGVPFPLFVLEAAGAQTVSGFVTAMLAGPTDETGQSVTNYSVSSSAPSLFAVAPAVALDGTLTFTLAANANGTATLTVIGQDDGGTADGGVNRTTNTLSLTVTPVNDAPTLTLAIASLGVAEDSGLTTYSNLVASFSPGPADEAAQTRIGGYTVTNSQPALFTVQPSVDADGTLTFEGATNATGTITVGVTAQDSGGTANGGTDLGTATFLVILQEKNDAPSFTLATNDVVVLEDAGAQSVANFIATRSVGPSFETSSQTITNFTVTTTNVGFFAVAPALGTNGTLTFQVATNANGTTTLSVVARDDGGTSNGGTPDSATLTFTLTVTAVNDAPTFTLMTNVLRDGLLQRSQSGIEASGSARRVVVDAYGNYVVAGESGNGELETTDAVVIKYTAGGLPVWTNRFEVAGRGEVRDLALDPQGGVVLAAVSLTSGNENVVVIRYQADGGIIWSNRYEGGVGVPAAPNAVAVDSNGSVIVTGYRKDGVYKDFLTLRYSASGDLLWTNVTSSAETVGNDEALAVVVDSSGDVYVAGNGSDTDYTYGYVLKLDGTFGSAMWTNQLADPGFNQNGGFAAMALAANGDIVVGGHLQQAFKEFAVVRYSAAGAPAWTNLYQRTAADQQVRALRTSGNLVYVTGDTSNGTDSDFTTLMISSNGIPAWTNHYNGAGAMDADLPVALAVNSSGEVLVTGHSTRDGLKDIVTLKYTAAGGPVWTNRFNGVQMMNDEPFGLATGTAGEVYVAASAAGLPADSTSVFWTLRYGQLPAGGADQVIDTTMGTTFSLAGFIGSVSVGPANESVQALSYVVNNSNPGLFTGDPFIGASGLLTFAAAGTSAGVAVVTVRAQDDGGTANGGANQSAPLTFNITVTTGIVATAYSWVGGTGGGNWNNVTNWSPNGVPGPNDSATVSVIGAVEVTNATVVRNLTLEDVTLHGSGGVAVTTQFT